MGKPKSENSWVIEHYPFMKVRGTSRNPFAEDGGTEPDSWHNSIPQGWWKAFGIQMLDELKTLLEKASEIDSTDWVDGYRIYDIKEKWGMLRWDADIPSSMFDEFLEWEEKYEDLSGKYCILCGKPSEGYSEGWIVPLCRECAEKNNISFTPFGEKK